MFEIFTTVSRKHLVRHFAKPMLAAVLFLIVILFIFHFIDKLCQQKYTDDSLVPNCLQ
jgi:lipopolysaccharide export LptBFGC system permease protein LptF